MALNFGAVLLLCLAGYDFLNSEEVTIAEPMAHRFALFAPATLDVTCAVAPCCL
jgi:hypothetical protein